jgi:hypothetical protein
VSTRIYIIAAFWADVDTRNTSSGLVYYRIETSPNRLTVIWDQVGYYSYHVDKLCTFELIITDGMDPLIGIGNNVAFCYDNMDWTTGDASGGSGGFGGSPATVGINKGDGSTFAQVGRFDKPGIMYDGPGGLADGVDYLDNKSFFFSTCTFTNIPPAPTGFPPGPVTIYVGDTYNLTVQFLSPEVNQITTTTVDAGTLSDFTYTSTPGNVSTVVMQLIGTCGNVGMNTIHFAATDDGDPVETTYVDLVIYVVDNQAPVPDVAELPVAMGECNVSLTAPTATDECAGPVTGTTSDPVYYSEQGTYYVTWTYDDGNGNSVDQMQTVVVEDITPPEITCPDDVTYNCVADIPELDPYAATATDNCSAIITVTETNNGGFGCMTSPLILNRFFTATDPGGNTASCNQVITVATPPVIFIAPPLPKCDASMSAYWDCTNLNCVEVTATKDLSNLVLMDCDGTHFKFDNLNQGNSGTFCHPSGLPVTTVWIKAGCYKSGDGPGYGRRFDAPCNYCPRVRLLPVDESNSFANAIFEINVYPNPTNGEFTLMVNSGSNSAINVSLYDLTGKKILDVPDVNPNIPCNITHKLSKGIYLIRIEQDGKYQSVRLIKN